jgi:hypothetical protein
MDLLECFLNSLTNNLCGALGRSDGRNHLLVRLSLFPCPLVVMDIEE